MLTLTKEIVERADKYNVSFNAKKTIGAFTSQKGDTSPDTDWTKMDMDQAQDSLEQ